MSLDWQKRVVVREKVSEGIRAAARVGNCEIQIDDLLLLEFHEDECASVTRELLRFLALVASAPPKTFSPSPDIDKAWHCLLLDPVLYFDVCLQIQNDHHKDKKLIGRSILIPHNPKGALDPRTERRERYVATLEAYKRRYFECAPSEFWPEDYATHDFEEREESSSESDKADDDSESTDDAESAYDSEFTLQSGFIDDAESTDDTNQEPAMKKVKMKETETLAEKITLTIKSTKCRDVRVSVPLRSMMKELYDLYVKRMGREMEDCYFTFNGQRLWNLNDSVLSSGLDNDDVIIAHKVVDDANRANETINIEVQSFELGSSVCFNVTRTTTFLRVQQAYEKRYEGPFYYMLNGERCCSHQTLADLEIADGDVIFAHIIQTGC